MINRLHALWHRPEKGWDPVPPYHAQRYAEGEWVSNVREDLLDALEEWVGGFSGKRVLDLGGGPGQYSVAFARRGAAVTWHDVSDTYRRYAEQKAQEHGVRIDFSLDYMDEASKMWSAEFDLVFNRICWNYCLSDSAFAHTLFALIKPGGVGYVDTTHSNWRRETLSSGGRFRTWLNDALAVKIGHPFPPHGRVARLFADLHIEKMLVDYSTPTNDRILFRRAKGA